MVGAKRKKKTNIEIDFKSNLPLPLSEPEF